MAARSSTSFKISKDINIDHNDLANALRFLSIDAVQKANSGHPGMPMGMADVATVLFSKHIKLNPKDPHWPDRDRFVLSAGHGSMLLYALNYCLGYDAMTLEEIQNFRQLKSRTPGHPEVDVEAGIETTTGPLGQGIATAIGMAIAERHLNAQFGDDLVDHTTYVIASDGDLMEGVSHEACSLAGHLKLAKLIVLYDDNNISIDGPTSISFSDDSLKRFESYGWDVQSIDGHDPKAIDAALEKAKSTDTPSLIACKTRIGFGSPNKENTAGAHGSPLGEEEILATRNKLGWAHDAFDIPKNILDGWRAIGAQNQGEQENWTKRYKKSKNKKEFDNALSFKSLDKLEKTINALKKNFIQDKNDMATRKASGAVLKELIKAVPELLGGSADLTPSNNTFVEGMGDMNADDFSGRYIRYGVREHAMGSIMNGLALHGGIIPYGGTFLTFTDYCRPAIRLGTLMKQCAIYVMTHDSIGLGEDGPTHQPVEHLSSLRAIPHLQVLRPADAVETAECWQLAIESDVPTVIALSRQSLPTVREIAYDENLCAKGAYILRETDSDHPDLTLVSTGSEISLAIETSRVLLSDYGLNARVVSMPSRGRFLEQSYTYRQKVLGQYPRFIIEAGVRLGWDRLMNDISLFFGVESFGESAPHDDLYKHFRLTPKDIAERIARQVEM